MEGGEVVKIIKRSEGGAELILLLRMVCVGGGARHINFPFETHFSAPLLTIIAQSLNDLQFLALERIHFVFWFLFYNERTDTIVFAH